jgi:hypothetical protein
MPRLDLRGCGPWIHVASGISLELSLLSATRNEVDERQFEKYGASDASGDPKATPTWWGNGGFGRWRLGWGNGWHNGGWGNGGGWNNFWHNG